VSAGTRFKGTCQTYQIDARVFHPPVGVLGELWSSRAAGLGVGPDRVASFTKREGQKQGTYLKM
jgi:hypothetical protein